MTREELIQKIYDTFPLHLGEGISWEQSKVIDAYGTPEEEAAARRKDARIPWPDLVADPNFWYVGGGLGGFTFLDPIGFRHYLAPLMVRTLRDGSEGKSMVLHIVRPPPNSQFDALTPEMRHLIAHFIQCMRDVILERDGDYPAESWQKALEDYWHQFL